jgi:hypothetical protein
LERPPPIPVGVTPKRQTDEASNLVRDVWSQATSPHALRTHGLQLDTKVRVASVLPIYREGRFKPMSARGVAGIRSKTENWRLNGFPAKFRKQGVRGPSL